MLEMLMSVMEDDTPVTPGQVLFSTVGTFSWIVPAKCKEVSAKIIAGGGAGGNYGQITAATGGGGGGGGSTYKTFEVAPYETLKIVVASRGVANSGSGGISSISRGDVVIFSATGGGGGGSGSSSAGAAGAPGSSTGGEVNLVPTAASSNRTGGQANGGGAIGNGTTGYGRGGTGGLQNSLNPVAATSGTAGAVRIIWGEGRKYPSDGIADV